MREITTDPTGVSRASVELDLMWQPGLISEAVVSVVLSLFSASIAQSVERVHGKDEVISSNLIGSSISNEGAHIVNIIWRLLLGRLRFLTFRHLI